MSNNPWTPKYAPADDVHDWREDGTCTQVGPDLFMSTAADDQQAAKALCATCPVLSKCRPNSLTNGNQFGVEGGMTADERERHPKFRLAAPMSEFVPLTEAVIAARFEKEQAVIDRRAVAEARPRGTSRSPSSELPS